MILDNLSQSQRYIALSPHFAKAFEFLRTFDGSAKNGRYDLDADNVYALVQRYTTKPQADGVFEAHRRYIDVQFVFQGRETIYWAPIESLAAHTKEAYKEEGDFALFAQVPTATPLRMSGGQFTILFPEDAHIPCSQWDGPCEVTKVVVKVKV